MNSLPKLVIFSLYNIIQYIIQTIHSFTKRAKNRFLGSTGHGGSEKSILIIFASNQRSRDRPLRAWDTRNTKFNSPNTSKLSRYIPKIQQKGHKMVLRLPMAGETLYSIYPSEFSPNHIFLKMLSQQEFISS